ncbi:MAG: hypothetical protein D3904_10280 [Candidatus Electrothrix sp. EH2]|nr:hypothetical protein [Candidatus Electrothrix sp. EH2]
MEDIRYLNVDLLIKSRDNLTPIVKAFGEDVIVLSNNKVGKFHHAYFEIAGSYAGPNEDIEYFCSLIEGLEKEEKILWDNSFYRVFDIGYESGTSNNSYSSDLKGYIVKKIAIFNASIRVTIYPFTPAPEINP